MSRPTLSVFVMTVETVLRLMTTALDTMVQREGRRKEDAFALGTLQICVSKLRRLIDQFHGNDDCDVVQREQGQVIGGWECPVHKCAPLATDESALDPRRKYYLCEECNAWYFECGRAGIPLKLDRTPDEHEARWLSLADGAEGCPACGNAVKEDGRCTVCKRDYSGEVKS